jgi:hypothetical protein
LGESCFHENVYTIDVEVARQHQSYASSKVVDIVSNGHSVGEIEAPEHEFNIKIVSDLVAAIGLTVGGIGEIATEDPVRHEHIKLKNAKEI